MDWMFALRLLAALVCGMVIGFERERRERAAGLRTHTLVAMSSALIMLISAYSFSDIAPLGLVPRDPTRIAAQAVSGIGFLGAGVIIFRKNTVSGLTTAASIWAAAAVGLACGGGLFTAALMGTVGILFIQIVLRFFEYRFFAHNHPSVLSLRIRREAGGSLPCSAWWRNRGWSYGGCGCVRARVATRIASNSCWEIPGRAWCCACCNASARWRG